MAKSSKIRWSRNDLNRLRKDIKYYNQKVTREVQKGKLPEEAIPPKMSIKDIRDNVQSRKELNNIYKQLEYMRTKEAMETVTNKYGLTITNAQIKHIQNQLKIVNQNRSSEREIIENLKLKSRGTQTGYLVKDRLDDALNDLKPKKFNFDKKKKSDWQSFVDSVEKQSSYLYNEQKMTLFKENYIKSIRTVFGDDRAEEIIKLIGEVSTEEFMKNFYQDTESNISFNYNENETLEMRYKSIKKIWKKQRKK